MGSALLELPIEKLAAKIQNLKSKMAFTIENRIFALRPAEQLQISLRVAAAKLAPLPFSHRMARKYNLRHGLTEISVRSK